MRVGVDTYSYHRLLGELRAGESPPFDQLADGGPAAVSLSVALGCDVVSIQTCFLPAAPDVDTEALLVAADGRELIVSWGAPDGLAYGLAPDALDDATAWMDVARALDSTVMRIVLGGPAYFDSEPSDARRRRVVPHLRTIAERASALGLELAIENHGDIRAGDLLAILDETDHPALGVCFDSANAARVGDDPAAAATALSDFVRLIHLKDVEDVELVTDRVAGPRSVPYGTGIVPLVAVLGALHDPIEAGAAVCVELGQIADGTDEVIWIRDGIEWLRGHASVVAGS